MIAAKQHCIAIGSTKYYYIYDWNFTNGMEIKEQITGHGQQTIVNVDGTRWMGLGILLAIKCIYTIKRIAPMYRTSAKNDPDKYMSCMESCQYTTKLKNIKKNTTTKLSILFSVHSFNFIGIIIWRVNESFYVLDDRNN